MFHLALWCALGLLAVFVVGVVLGVVASFVAQDGGPGKSSSGRGGGSGALAVLDFPLEILGQIGWIFLPLILLWLLLRRLGRLAVFVAVVGLGAVALDLGLARAVRAAASFIPSLDGASAGTPDSSALFTTVTLGVLLSVFLPVMSAAARGWTIGVVTLADAAIVTGAALGTDRHPSALIGWSSVLIGWLIAVAWLTVTALIFLRPRTAPSGNPHGLFAGGSPQRRALLLPAPVHDAPLAAGRRSGMSLAFTAALLCVGLIGSGLLITGYLEPVRRFDIAVIEWFVGIRTPELTTIAHVVDPLGNTPGIIMVLITAMTLASALTRRWAPILFLLTATTGETAVFLVSQAVVGRPRPPVERLADLPATLSFPSGHVAASAVTYGAIALLLLAWAGGRLGWIAVVLAAVIVVGVALARFYAGMHYPTDILFSLLFAAVWLTVCWHAFRPDRGSPSVGAQGAQPDAG